MTVTTIETETTFSSQPRMSRRYASAGCQRLETVLMIEDDRELSNALAIRLQRAGLTVARAYDGPSGLERYRLLEPDVVILDLGLPRMDGSKLLHFLRMTPGLRAVPVIVITGSSNAALVRKASNWGVTKVLRKPVIPRQLVETTLAALDGEQ